MILVSRDQASCMTSGRLWDNPKPEAKFWLPVSRAHVQACSKVHKSHMLKGYDPGRKRENLKANLSKRKVSERYQLSTNITAKKLTWMIMNAWVPVSFC